MFSLTFTFNHNGDFNSYCCSCIVVVVVVIATALDSGSLHIPTIAAVLAGQLQ